MCRMHPADELADALDVPQEQILEQQKARLARPVAAEPKSPLSDRLRDALTTKLKKKLDKTLEEFEQENVLDTSDMSNVPGQGKGWKFFEDNPQFKPGDKVPFGWLHKQWTEFKSHFREGDELWTYDDIGFLSGTSGYALVRNGRIFDYFPTCMS